MKAYFIFCLSVLLLSCSSSKETPTEIYDLSFTCPAGWSISEQEDYGSSKYISIEKSGISSSGIAMITYADEDVELVDFLDIYKESLAGQKVLSDIKFKEAKETSYGQYAGLVCEYTVSILSVAHEGRLYVFHANGKTACITEQEATEDKAKNKDGFEKIKETLQFN